MFEKDGKFFAIKTIKYKKIDGVEHEYQHIFEEIDPKKIQEKYEFLKEKLKDKISTEDILKEAIKCIPIKDLDRMVKILKNKKGVKISKQKGCLGIQIDGGKHNKCYLNIYD